MFSLTEKQVSNAKMAAKEYLEKYPETYWVQIEYYPDIMPYSNDEIKGLTEPSKDKKNNGPKEFTLREIMAFKYVRLYKVSDMAIKCKINPLEIFQKGGNQLKLFFKIDFDKYTVLPKSSSLLLSLGQRTVHVHNVTEVWYFNQDGDWVFSQTDQHDLDICLNPEDIFITSNQLIC